MNRHSHILIAEFTLKHYLPQATPLQKKALIAGCVYPDRNPFTYLKGSLRHRRFHGHHWDNAQKHIEKICRRIEGYKSLTWRSCFDIGQLLHYGCDGFTYAHNRDFHQGLRQHRMYESQLHRKLSAVILQKTELPREGLWQFIEREHRQYRSAPRGLTADSGYIWKAVLRICQEIPRLQGNFNKNSFEICPICTCKTETRVI